MAFLLRRHSKSNSITSVEVTPEKPVEEAGRWRRLKRPLSIMEPRRPSIPGGEQPRSAIGSPSLSEPVAEEQFEQEEFQPPAIPQRSASRTFFRLKSIMINRSTTDLSSLIKGYGSSPSGHNSPAISIPTGEANSRSDPDLEINGGYESAEEEDDLRFLEGIDRSIGQWISISDDFQRYSICESTTSFASAPSSPTMVAPEDREEESLAPEDPEEEALAPEEAVLEQEDLEEEDPEEALAPEEAVLEEEDLEEEEPEEEDSEEENEGEFTVTHSRTISSASTAIAAIPATGYGHKHAKSNSLTLSSSSSLSFMSAATPTTPVMPPSYREYSNYNHYGVVFVGGIDEMIEEEGRKHEEYASVLFGFSHDQEYFDEEEDDVILLSDYRRVRTVL
ncbi:hypothetical protein TRVA0_021S00254 [Trichomonascus vanleenenianus]|uniref:uncharacterized protein n=1 Tax=Trichomonascus vanleenenianus TaxID=2268995 RepID=UPI003ECAD860